MHAAPRREYLLVLLVAAAGAGLVVLAVRQAWGQAVFVAPRPLPAEQIGVSGTELVPLAGALALAALACLAAVIATRSVARRVAGVLLALLGVGTAAAAMSGVGAAAVVAAARADATSSAVGGSTTSGTSPGDASHAIVIAGAAAHAVLTGAPWRAAAVVGAVAIVAAGLATAWRGPRWPVMSTRYELPPAGARGVWGGGQPPQEQGGSGGDRSFRSAGPGGDRSPRSAEMWESLSRDVDPTEEYRS
jgi:uncharacterized membrane protein (TIGR02234 family)